jgi:hypothetical protein
MSEEKKNYCKEAVISEVLAFVSVLLIFPLFLLNAAFSIASIVVGIIALKKIKLNPELIGKKYAVIGISLSSLVILFDIFAVWKLSTMSWSFF